MGEQVSSENPRRRALKVAAGAICSEVGFTAAEESVLESLTEMLQSFITEVGRSAQAYAELSGRTLPMTSDVVIALVEMGFDVESLPSYAKNTKNIIFMPPTPALPTPQARTLQVGTKNNHPSHIPDHLPPFPDQHTYIKTPSYKQPVSEYQIVREKAASQKRDVERALTRFIAKTGETETLFQDDPYAFPLIANKPKPLPYIEALMSREESDRVDDEDHSHKVAAQTPMELESSPPKKIQAMDKTLKSPGSAVAPPQGGIKQPPDPQTPKVAPEDGANNTQTTPGGSTANPEQDSDGTIDNPYLRPIIMPRLKGISKKHKWWHQ